MRGEVAALDEELELARFTVDAAVAEASDEDEAAVADGHLQSEMAISG